MRIAGYGEKRETTQEKGWYRLKREGRNRLDLNKGKLRIRAGCKKRREAGCRE